MDIELIKKEGSIIKNGYIYQYKKNAEIEYIVRRSEDQENKYGSEYQSLVDDKILWINIDSTDKPKRLFVSTVNVLSNKHRLYYSPISSHLVGIYYTRKLAEIALSNYKNSDKNKCIFPYKLQYSIQELSRWGDTYLLYDSIFSEYYNKEENYDRI